MSVVVNGATGLTINGVTQNSSAKFGQIVSATIDTRYSTSSTSFTQIGPSISITPKSATSKIMLLATLSYEPTGYCYLSFARNGTDLVADTIAKGGNVAATYSNVGTITWAFGSYPWQNCQMHWLDSPGTTSAITYTILGRVSSGTFYFNDYSTGDKSMWYAIEIFA
jgi:hypothetical protein